MPLPFFYTESFPSSAKTVMLDEENSKHAVQVLRMQEGEQLRLTDGKGNLYTAEIAAAHKKKAVVIIIDHTQIPAPEKYICIAVSPVKNNSRLEWFLEKATEIGVSAIVPLICTRTEKQHFRYDRMNAILISAMLQSQQAWLPTLSEPVKYERYIASLNDSLSHKFIAHCDEQHKTSLKDFLSQTNKPINQATILIGPEGDFTKEEIALAFDKNFTPVALGNTRLRTETAALVAGVLLCVE